MASAAASLARGSSNGGRRVLNTGPYGKISGYSRIASAGCRRTKATCWGLMPAKSSSPATSAASLTIGSSTTTTISLSTCGGPPMAAGKSVLLANTHLRCGSCVMNRNGPFPTGRKFQDACRRRACGTLSRRCAGRIARSVNTSGKSSGARAAAAPEKWSATVESSGAAIDARVCRSVRRGYPVAGSRAACRVQTTSRPVVLGVVTLTFLLLHAAPGDPVDIMLGPTATAEQLAAQRRALGLDQPLPRQFATWVGRSARGDWGTSIATGRPVAAMLGNAWPATARLVVLSLILSYLIGLAVGALQAARSGSRLDTLLSVVSVTLFGIPGYWLGLMLVLVFTYWARLLPAFGIAGLDSDYLQGTSLLVDRLRHLALPLVTLTLIGIGGAARFVRGAMLETLSQPFITTAWAKGLTARRVVGRHALRNALTPVVILLGLSLPALFSGAVFVETVFAWPGVGRVLVEAVKARDYPVVMGATAVSPVVVVAGNGLGDVLAAWLDPRVRSGEAAQ